jgi:hypothetical protein
MHNGYRAESTWSTAKALYAEGGIPAFFRGLPARATRLCGAVFILGESQFQISTAMNEYGLWKNDDPSGADGL